jgi:hypothetical protein
MAALVLLGQRDGLVQLLFLDRPGEVRRELAGCLGALVNLPELVQRDGQREERHAEEDEHDPPSKGMRVMPQSQNIYTHGTAPLTVRNTH